MVHHCGKERMTILSPRGGRRLHAGHLSRDSMIRAIVERILVVPTSGRGRLRHSVWKRSGLDAGWT